MNKTTSKNTSIESRYFKEVASNLSDAIVIADKEGRVTWTNQAFHALCGYSEEEVIGKRPGDLLQGEETDSETVGALRHAVRNGQSIRADILNYHKEGYSYWVSIVINPLKGEDGELSGFVAIERDVTNQRKDSAFMERQIVEVYSAILSLEDPQLNQEGAEDPFRS